MSSTAAEGAAGAVASSVVGGRHPIFGNDAPQRAITAGLSGVIRAALTQYDQGLRTAMPAQVVTVHDDFTVDVLPGFKMRYRNEPQARAMPVLPSVPVMMPAGAGYAARLPVAKGDTGLVLILDRSPDTWLAGDGSAADPKSPNLHALSDAVFLPGLFTTAAATRAGARAGAVTLENGNARLQLSKAGGVALGNGRAELISALSAFADSLGGSTDVATQAASKALTAAMNLLKG